MSDLEGLSKDLQKAQSQSAIIKSRSARYRQHRLTRTFNRLRKKGKPVVIAALKNRNGRLTVPLQPLLERALNPFSPNPAPLFSPGRWYPEGHAYTERDVKKNTAYQAFVKALENQRVIVERMEVSPGRQVNHGHSEYYSGPEVWLSLKALGPNDTAEQSASTAASLE